MKNTRCALLLIIVWMAACRPRPVAIDVEQGPKQIAIASTALDSRTIFIAASYSITSLYNLNDTGNGQHPNVPSTDIFLDSALITISDGLRVDTLSKISAGLYRTLTMNLMNGVTYMLEVRDYRSGQTVVAATQYQPMLTLDSIRPFVDRRAHDTAVQLIVDMHDDRPGTDYYIMAYDNINPNTIPSAIGSNNFAILNTDEMKRVEVFSDAEAISGHISKTFNLEIGTHDTLFVQYGRITKGYYDFLSSYKRSGSILTQATGEPVTLPTNIVSGLGYFALYEAGRSEFVLSQY